jgi:hypothetical protein
MLNSEKYIWTLAGFAIGILFFGAVLLIDILLEPEIKPLD